MGGWVGGWVGGWRVEQASEIFSFQFWVIKVEMCYTILTCYNYLTCSSGIIQAYKMATQCITRDVQGM